jgi:glycosyltransferase involved in cell wall biosynthesis
MKILWQGSSSRLYDAVTAGDTPQNIDGGSAYEFDAIRALSETYDIQIDPDLVQRPTERMYSYWRRVRRTSAVADVLIKQPKVVVCAPVKLAPCEIGVVHHIDKRRLRNELYAHRLLARLGRLTCVVTVSQYWAKWLRKEGCRDVRVIYNSFDLSEFRVSGEEICDLRHSLGVPAGVPLVYIGNGSAAKGVIEVYEALRDRGYHLIMSGRALDTRIPVTAHNFDRADYLRMLAACDVVVAMPRMVEGWGRVAHEAMLCGTPVVGSGAGGMLELLTGGRQIVVKNINELPAAVEAARQRGVELGRSGFAFAQRFDQEYFRTAWTGLVREFTGKSASRANTKATI